MFFCCIASFKSSSVVLSLYFIEKILLSPGRKQTTVLVTMFEMVRSKVDRGFAGRVQKG